MRKLPSRIQAVSALAPSAVTGHASSTAGQGAATATKTARPTAQQVPDSEAARLAGYAPGWLRSSRRSQHRPVSAPGHQPVTPATHPTGQTTLPTGHAPSPQAFSGHTCQALEETTMHQNHPAPGSQHQPQRPARVTAAMTGPPRRQLRDLEKTGWSRGERLRFGWYRLRLAVAEMNYATRRMVELQAIPISGDSRR
jgi:hypothetical protein